MKKFRMGAALLAMVVSLGMTQVVFAQAKSFQVLEMVQTEEKVEAKVEPQDSAQVGKVYEPGDIMLIVEGGNEQWHAVAYQGNMYYVKKEESKATKAPVIVVEDAENNTTTEIVLDEKFKEELDAEMEVERHESKAQIEEYGRHQKETNQKRIWGAIIGVLVVAILGVSVYSYVSGKKKEDKAPIK